jgi:Flp pilus assembly protein TadB
VTALPVVLALALALLLVDGPSRRARAAQVSPARSLDLRLAAPLAGVGVAVLLGGPAGLVCGAVVAIAAWLLVPRLRSRAQVERARRLVRDAPLVVDLLAACLASGSSVEDALAATGRAVPGPAGELLATAAAALRLGADPEQVWDAVAELPELAPLARAAARSARTGAPLGALLPRVADDLRASHRAAVEARTRTAAVRLTAPLGAAFLPAFLLLGVVPVVASWVGSVL